MVRVQLKRCCVVLYRSLKVAFLSISKPSVMVEVCLATFKFNGLCETMDCFFIGTFPVKRDPLIVVSKRILRVNSDCLGIIVDSSIKLTYLVKSKSPVEKRLKMLREYLKRS